MKKYLFLFLAVAVLSSGCKKKDDDHDHDEYNPTITFTIPAEGASIEEGEELHIEADIHREDNKLIHNVSVLIEDEDGNVVEKLVDNEHIHAEGHHHIHEHYHAHLPGNYKVRIITTDHDEHAGKVEATRSFTVTGAATYDVAVDIQEPAESTVINVNDDLPVKVVFTHDHGGTIHHVRIEIIDENEDVVDILTQGHVHVEGTYTFESADAFTATTAGFFRIVAMSMNHDMSIMKMADRAFEVQ